MTEEQKIQKTGVVEVTPELIGDAMNLVHAFGHCVAEVIDQMLKGNWVDDHGHKVTQNVQMLELRDVLDRAIEFRDGLIQSAMNNPVELEDEPEVKH